MHYTEPLRLLLKWELKTTTWPAMGNGQGQRMPIGPMAVMHLEQMRQGAQLICQGLSLSKLEGQTAHRISRLPLKACQADLISHQNMKSIPTHTETELPP